MKVAALFNQIHKYTNTEDKKKDTDTHRKQRKRKCVKTERSKQSSGWEQVKKYKRKRKKNQKYLISYLNYSNARCVHLITK